MFVSKKRIMKLVGNRLREALDSRQVSLDFVLWRLGSNDGFLSGGVTWELLV